MAALLVVGGASLAAAEHWWPFDANPRKMESFDHPTLWQIVTADRVTVGMFRIAILSIVAFVAVSIPALVLAGRWLKAFGTQSIAADTADEAKDVIGDLQGKVLALEKELDKTAEQRDTAMEIAEGLMRRGG
jgi:hypothetical protein